MAPAAHHVLRRALIGGYRVADVEIALAELRLAATRVEAELAAAVAGRRAAEQQSDDLRRELSSAQRESAAAQAEADAIRTTLGEISESARRSVFAAQEEAAAARRQAEEAQLVRQRLGRQLLDLAHALDDAPRPDAAPPAPFAYALATPALVGPALELDAGPFDELADVIAFERALRGLPDVGDVYLRQFEDRRAHVEIVTAKPVRLVEDIVAHLPFPFDVAPSDNGHVVLTRGAAGGETS
jgi:hypothetical protein